MIFRGPGGPVKITSPPVFVREEQKDRRGGERWERVCVRKIQRKHTYTNAHSYAHSHTQSHMHSHIHTLAHMHTRTRARTSGVLPSSRRRSSASAAMARAVAAQLATTLAGRMVGRLMGRPVRPVSSQPVLAASLLGTVIHSPSLYCIVRALVCHILDRVCLGKK